MGKLLLTPSDRPASLNSPYMCVPVCSCAAGQQQQWEQPVAGGQPQQALGGGVFPGVQPLLDPVGAVHPRALPAV